jgi:uncharacterized phage infection (PIP) family protein YhgE
VTRSFYENLLRDRLFQDAIGDRDLTEQDHGLIAIVCASAERMLGESRKKVARLQAEKETEKVRTKAALMLSFDRMQRISEIATTPIDELIRRMITGGTGQPDATIEMDTQRSSEPSSDPESTSSRHLNDEAFKKLPYFLQWPVIAVQNTVARMSPLAIAVWFILIVTGSVAYAKYSVSRVESTYSNTVKQRDDFQSQLTKSRASVEQLRSEVDQLRTERSDLANTRDRLTAEVAKLHSLREEERSQFDKTLASERASHQEQLNRFTSNLEEASRARLEALSTENAHLKQMNETLDRKADDLTADLDKLAALHGDADGELRTQQQTNEKLREDLRAERSRNTELQAELDDHESLIPFIQDLARSVDIHFFKRSKIELYSRRDCFRDNYRQLYQSARDVLSKNRVREDMEFASGDVSQDSIERCRESLY